MDGNSQRQTKFIRSISRKNSILLLNFLNTKRSSTEEFTQKQIGEYVDLIQPDISQALGILLDFGFAKTRNDGRQKFYRFDIHKIKKTTKLINELCDIIK